MTGNRRWLMATTLAAIADRAGADDAPTHRSPVLVELFTSEGCSSCPPADILLEKLDRLQPVAGAEAIVLSEHVDYWNHIGWRDPYSSAEFSRRQEAYARRLRLESVYTPQMIVDGETEFVGSDGRRAVAAITAASKPEKAAVRLAKAPAGLRIEVAPLPKAAGRGSAEVYLVAAEESGSSDVTGGENKGRYLRHVAIARRIVKLGKVDAKTALSQDVAAGGVLSGGTRWIAFAQEPSTGRVWGAAMLPASPVTARQSGR